MKTRIVPSFVLLGPVVCLAALLVATPVSLAKTPDPFATAARAVLGKPLAMPDRPGASALPVRLVRFSALADRGESPAGIAGGECSATADSLGADVLPDVHRAQIAGGAASSLEPCQAAEEFARRAIESQAAAGAADLAALQAAPTDADTALLETALHNGEVGPFLTAAEVAGLTVAMAGDLDAYWARAFAAEGRYYSRPSFVLIEGVTPTPCAWAGVVAPGAGSFYCPWNQTIYLDLAAIRAEATHYGAAGLLFTLAHEWGHHAQFQRGSLQERSQAVELAADCLAGAYLADAVGRGWIAAEVVSDGVSGIVATLGDPLSLSPAATEAHGTGEQRTAMLLAGYAGGTAACG